MGIPHLFSCLKEEDITPVQTLCAGNTQEFRTKMQQLLVTWKTSQRIIFPTNLNPEHFDSRRRGISTSSAPRCPQKHLDDVDNGSNGSWWTWSRRHKKPGADLESKRNLNFKRAEEDHGYTSVKERAGKWDATAGQASWQIQVPWPCLWDDWCDNTISPDHINMLSQTHTTLDRRLSGRPQIIPEAIKNEVDEGYYSSALEPSLDFVITVH